MSVKANDFVIAAYRQENPRPCESEKNCLMQLVT